MDVLRCQITLPNGKMGTFGASVTGNESHFTVVLS